MLDFRNLNTLWASTLVETLYRCGLQTAIVCPGSRSAPLTVAFAQHPSIEAIPVLDERSASFFALGIAQRTGKPVALVCTSGTAGANFYPAVIEAKESRIPLLVLTADRPPELRDCNAGQAIDQQKLFGDFPNYYAELSIPEVNQLVNQLGYLRQKVANTFEQTRYPQAAAVHLNIPLRDPLAPIAQPEIQALAEAFPEDFFGHLELELPVVSCQFSVPSEWRDRRGIIIAGVARSLEPEKYCQAIARLSQYLGYPVLAEGLSPVRNFASLQPHLITTYDGILRHADRANANNCELTPDLVIRIGEMPTSKVLREWLTQTQPETWIIDRSQRSIDPIHGRSRQIHASIEDLVVPELSNPTSNYLASWKSAEQPIRHHIDQTLTAVPHILESKIAWLLPQLLPENTPIFIANSMPVRDVEYFWPGNDRRIQPFFNRGANGIDGTLSSAIGIAHGGQPAVLLTGDLALLHDTNGFLIQRYLRGSLTIILNNNNGGGIFSMLPIAQFEPPFEEFFSTPQSVNFADLCQTYGVEHTIVADWNTLTEKLKTLPQQGIRVLEIPCDRTIDVPWRKQFLQNLATPSGTTITKNQTQ